MHEPLVALNERLRRDLGAEAHRVRITAVEADGVLPGIVRIRAALTLDNVVSPLAASGPTPELAYGALLGEVLERVEQLRELVDRATEACWVCDAGRSRTEMSSELIGSDTWWLCGRCRRRRDNAARIGTVWPADFGAWWRRWSALRRAEGRDEAWIAAVRSSADAVMESDPRTPNRMAAVLKVVEAG